MLTDKKRQRLEAAADLSNEEYLPYRLVLPEKAPAPQELVSLYLKRQGRSLHQLSVKITPWNPFI